MNNIDNKIIDIENGLRAEYVIKGDKFKSINDLMKETNTPGISIAIINNFEVVGSKEYGVLDKESQKQVNKNTIFQAASISKPIAALAVMKLVQDGILDLDEDVNVYLKSWKVPQNDFTCNNKVTLRKLMSHTAGVTVHGFAGYKIDGDIPTLLQILNGNKPSNSEKITVAINPNSKFSYSGGGYTIIQQLMIDVLDKSFEEIMKELVLEPLGMNNSFYSKYVLSEKQSINTATAYKIDGNEVAGKRHVYPEMAAAGLWTTSEDLAKFALEVQRTLKGESNKILTKEFMEIMTTPILHGEYNIGLANRKLGNENLLGHSGGNEGFTCDMLFHKEKGYGIIIMSNSDRGYEIGTPLIRSAAHAYGWENILNQEYEKEDLTEEKLKLFSGSYKMDFHTTIKIFNEKNKLFYKNIYEKSSKRLDYVKNNLLINEDRTLKIEYLEDQKKFNMDSSIIEPLKSEDKLASDYLEENDIDNAVKFYKNLMEKNHELKGTLEDTINDIGYTCLWKGNNDSAIKFLKINTILFPKSYNTWDSLGYAYFVDRHYDLAIECMKKSLEYNPENVSAIEIIEESERLKTANVL